MCKKRYKIAIMQIIVTISQIMSVFFIYLTSGTFSYGYYTIFHFPCKRFNSHLGETGLSSLALADITSTNVSNSASRNAVSILKFLV